MDELSAQQDKLNAEEVSLEKRIEEFVHDVNTKEESVNEIKNEIHRSRWVGQGSFCYKSSYQTLLVTCPDPGPPATKGICEISNHRDKTSSVYMDKELSTLQICSGASSCGHLLPYFCTSRVICQITWHATGKTSMPPQLGLLGCIWSFPIDSNSGAKPLKPACLLICFRLTSVCMMGYSADPYSSVVWAKDIFQLNSFLFFYLCPVVTDHHDKNLLNRLAKKARYRGNIIIQRFERCFAFLYGAQWHACVSCFGNAYVQAFYWRYYSEQPAFFDCRQCPWHWKWQCVQLSGQPQEFPAKGTRW